MPVTPTYPGVYVEEIPSGVRTITGVATSITAFIGRTRRGPVDQPVTVTNFGDVERIFGGLYIDSTLGHAVRDFYLNGGGQAIIVRLFHPSFDTDEERQQAFEEAEEEAQTAADAVAQAARDAAEEQDADAASVATAAGEAVEDAGQPGPAARAAAEAVARAAREAAKEEGADADSVATAAEEAVEDTVAAAAGDAAPLTRSNLTVDGLNLEARYPGSWGNGLRARVDHDTRPLLPDEAADSLFNLSIRDGETGQIEQFRNVSIISGHPRQVDRVLLNESRLVRMTGSPPTALPQAHPEPQPGRDVWGDPDPNIPNDPATNTKVADDEQASDGVFLEDDDFIGTGKDTAKEGLYALEKADLFNILCIPPYLNNVNNGNVDASVVTAAAKYCEDRRAMLLVDPPSGWNSVEKAIDSSTGVAGVGTRSKNAALFFPRLRQPNPLRDNQVEDFVPCGAVAGVFARTDATRGVWKAPAGLEATLVGVPQLSVPLTDQENGQLNPLGVNCLRAMPAVGPVVWGARTLQGDDRLASEWKYVPVRRLALYIEESLYRGTQWVVFEPNDEPLWSQIRLNIGAFMQNLFRQGAFQGKTPQAAYFVKCDKETTTQNDINLGIVNIVVGFAPLKPAEFVIIRIQQMAGQVEA
jgi:phage tail sheath protein FI